MEGVARPPRQAPEAIAEGGGGGGDDGELVEVAWLAVRCVGVGGRGVRT